MQYHIILFVMITLTSACTKTEVNGNWILSSDLTRKELDFPKGLEGDKSIAVMAAFVPRLTIQNNSWMLMRDSIRCTINKLDDDNGVNCFYVKDGHRPSGSMRLTLSGDILKIKDGKKPTYVYVREK